LNLHMNSGSIVWRTELAGRRAGVACERIHLVKGSG
jgi:hypothetical protein